MVEGIPFPIRGTVTLVSGDNLTSCFLGGYKAPSGALRKCHHCMVTTADMSEHVCFSLFSTIPKMFSKPI